MTPTDFEQLASAVVWYSMLSGFIGGFLGMFIIGFICDFVRSLREYR